VDAAVNASEPGYKMLKEMTAKEIWRDLEDHLWRVRDYYAARMMQAYVQAMNKEKE
jgi:hypothetical protein